MPAALVPDCLKSGVTKGDKYEPDINAEYSDFARHYYSVPWQYKGKRVKVIYTNRVVEIYHDNLRIAFHRRDRSLNKYTTLKEHMPPHHRFYDEWSPQRMIDWAEKIGPQVKEMITEVFAGNQHPEQAFKVCLGIINLSKKYGKQRLNRACTRALEFSNYSYKAVKNILEKGLDEIQQEPVLSQSVTLHENIRESRYYSQGGGR